MSKKILLVDDDKDMCSTLAAILKLDNKFEVDYTVSPLEALEKIERTEYSLIIIDYKMPEMNGIELLEQIKLIRKDACVLMLTAFISTDLIEKAEKTGALKVLSKFLWPKEICKQISAILE
ncbi:MAG: response regulator [Candidatus Omnitrophota bacterium]